MTSAGLQQGTLCWCGNATGPPVMAPETECNYRCPGDLWSFCGGVWRSSLFSLVDWNASNQPSVSASTTTIQPIMVTVTPMTATTTSTPVPTTPAPPAASSSAPAPSSGVYAPPGWSYVGCNGEPSGGRALTGAGLYMPQMTLESCTAFCADKGFIYAGMQYSAECYCGNTYAAFPITGCDSPCAGNAAQKCGGPYRSSLYIAAGASSRIRRSRLDTLQRHRGRARSLLDVV
jgi:hypothetical protein